MFYGAANPEVALKWIDAARGIATHMGFPPELLVRIATRVMQWLGKIWWDFAHTA